MFYPSSLIGLMVLLSLIHGGCQDHLAAFDRTERLLRIAENDALSFQEREHSVRQLGALKAKSAVPRLIRLLDEHDGDVLGYEIVFALGEIGDPAALPALLHVRDKDRNDVILPGGFNAVLNKTIEKLSKQSP